MKKNGLIQNINQVVDIIQVLKEKKGFLIQGEPYIVKYAKNSPQGLTCSYLSEYIGSHLFRIAGIEAQETFLGKCDGLPVVVMKDFMVVMKFLCRLMTWETVL